MTEDAGKALLAAVESLMAEVKGLRDDLSRDRHAAAELSRLRGGANERKARSRSKSRDSHGTESRDGHVTGGTIGGSFCSAPEKQEQLLNPLPPFRGHVTRVFEHWRATWGKPKAELTKDRERKIQARLRDGYAVERLCDAVSGATLDTWEGRKDQCDLTQLLKPSNVDKFADLWDKRRANGPMPLWKKQGFASAEEYGEHIANLPLEAKA